MQLKGLVRFFTILLIIISVYCLSFTWFVNGHENKLRAKAKASVLAKYPEVRNLQVEDYPDSARVFYEARLKRLEDSTKDVTLSYGPTGAISYQKAKNYELNLGLDLQGGMSVALEVEMTGLLKAMSNNSKDSAFLKAIDKANNRKRNSSADFITLFAEEYEKINPNGRLASIFATASQSEIKITDNNAQVVSVLRKTASGAFDRTFKIISTRIDQFGVAQPNINPDPSRGIINVELPGVRDKDRVRGLLQSTANLQFWLVYTTPQLDAALQQISTALNNSQKGIVDTSAVKTDTTTSATTAKVVDTTGKLSSIDGDTGSQTTTPDVAATNNSKGRSLYNDLIKPGSLGYYIVDIRDTILVNEYLKSAVAKRFLPADVKFAYGRPGADSKNPRALELYALRTGNRDKARIEGDAINSAKQSFDPISGDPTVTMTMNSQGSKEWEKMTDESFNGGKAPGAIPIAVVLDDVVYSAPGANKGKISGGNTEISGNFTLEEAQDLANILEIGKLPAPAKIVQEQVVGPTLGENAINGGIKAFVISFIIIFTLMLIYYNTSGWVANIALILNLLFTVGVLAGLGASLTAPGIAGLVLTIGMAVDTNVIIYERIKEELTKGKGYIPAVNEGYKRSLPPVLDAHVTTLLTAIILFYFGLGPVRGFATTQILGILLSLFCGILVSRWVTEWFTNKKRHLEYFTNVSRRVFKHANFKFIEYRKVAYGISVLVLALGIASIFHGFREGVEFAGGRSYQIGFDQKVSDKVEKIRDDLTAVFGEGPVIKTVKDNKTLDITTAYLIHETGAQTDSLVQRKLFEGLKSELPANLSYATFDSKYKLGSKKVLPTISDDLKAGAKKAVIISLIIIALYIFIRFRDWRYSLGTIVALLHDVLVTMAVFSFAKDLNLGFPLEIDQHFIAAILTVVGFSMNDTVIVFDRIREYSKQMVGVDKKTIINRAINDTLSRTIMTSLTVFLTILILFLVGGEVTKGFAFAMLIGVVTGTYSSIFVAAPILVDLAKKKPLGQADTVVESKPKTVNPTTATKPATTPKA